jgi:small-conductance mechanosensitive channel
MQLVCCASMTFRAANQLALRAWAQICLLLLTATLAAAQPTGTSTAEGQPTDEPQPSLTIVPLEQVATRSEEAEGRLRKLLAPVESAQETTAEVLEELDQTRRDFDRELEEIRVAAATVVGIGGFREIESRLTATQRTLGGQLALIDAAVRSLRRSLEEIDEMARTWEATLETHLADGVSESVLERVRSTQKQIERARSSLRTVRDEALAAKDRVVDRRRAADRVAQDLQTAFRSRLDGIFDRSEEPVWSAERWRTIRQALAEGSTSALQARLQRLSVYLQENLGALAFQTLVVALLCLVLRKLGERAHQQAEENYDLRDAERVFQHPVAMGLVTALVVAPTFHPTAPMAFRTISTALAVVPALIIVRRLAPDAIVPLVMAVPAFYFVDRIRDLLEALPTLSRLVLMIQLIIAIGLLAWLRRPSRLTQISPEIRQQIEFRVLAPGLRVTLILLATALVAEVIGLADLAELIGAATFGAAYAALLVYTLTKVSQSFLAYALPVRPLSLLRFVTHHRRLVRRQLDRVLSLGFTALWVWLTLDYFGIREAIVESVTTVLTTSVKAGSLSISLGNVGVFGLTLWLSFMLARFVNFVLNEDVFPRVQMARGVPYAISNLARYSLLFFGFFFALAAAGIELSRLTFIAGGLGVGIGFGLQNVVNNFVSGLILLFERPFQVGDVVQMPEVWGEIRRIGIRASVIRNWDGAELIVPNGTLVSQTVTNWTLADRQRRIEVPVGVEYGTDAQRVIELLTEVGRAHSLTLDDPQPAAFFMGFGDSSLDFLLRAWIPDFSEGYRVRSELAVDIQRALAEAGIGVPFPQRDLHVRSVSPDLAGGLASGMTKATTPDSREDEG